MDSCVCVASQRHIGTDRTAQPLPYLKLEIIELSPNSMYSGFCIWRGADRKCRIVILMHASWATMVIGLSVPVVQFSEHGSGFNSEDISILESPNIRTSPKFVQRSSQLVDIEVSIFSS